MSEKIGNSSKPNNPNLDESSRTSLIIQMHMAEFNQLREEINLYHDHQKEEIYFAMLVLGGVFASMLSEDIKLNPVIFLVFPLLFTLLAFAYADRTIRILRIASYIHQGLRENVIEKLGSKAILQWEVYKKYRVFKRKEEIETASPGCIQDRISLWYRRNFPELALILDVMRVTQFVLPSIFCIILYNTFNTNSEMLYQLILPSVLLIISLTPFYVFFISEETSGIELTPLGNTLISWEELQRSINNNGE